MLLVGVASCAVMGMGDAPGAAAFVLGAPDGSAGSSAEPSTGSGNPASPPPTICYRRSVPVCPPGGSSLGSSQGSSTAPGGPSGQSGHSATGTQTGLRAQGSGGGRRGAECSRARERVSQAAGEGGSESGQGGEAPGPRGRRGKGSATGVSTEGSATGVSLVTRGGR